MHVSRFVAPRAPSRRLLAAAASGALLAATLLEAGVGVAAAPSAADRFTRTGDSGTFSGFTPRALDKSPATFMLQLGADPVTVANANAGNALSNAQKDALKGQLKAAQGPVERAAQGLGAKVLGAYQLVYNGVKVQSTMDKAVALASIPGVVAIHRMIPVQPENVHGVPLVGAPAVWDGVAGLHGEGIKVGVIDTGVDYTHADFGGPGTVAAYQAALATDTAPANSAYFGPLAPKVKGGTDLVGDAYNASGSGPALVPHPDSNPLDCAGHGTHTSGTATGFGVLSDGTTYTGPYNASTISGHSWNVGPGVAPLADLYAIRVFGCAGTTNVVVDAIEWAVANGMDVINMSLGSPFGGADDPDAVASDNAAKAGVIVVASAGNNGHNPYVTGSPGASTRAISVAASDPTATFPGATIALSSDGTETAIEANGISVAGLSNLPVKVLWDSSGIHTAAHISLGCNAAEYTAAGVTGDLVVTRRGTCARVARAIFGQQAGAAAVLMVNSSSAYPPYEGPITSNPDTGIPYTVTIPFLGVPSTRGATWVAADGATATTFADTTLANPAYLALASFSSGGPRSGDSWLKPDVTAPGVSIASAGMGTGNQLAILSGTSMAAPHTAGMAALVKQAHPSWNSVEAWKAAIVNTADPTLVAGYSTRGAGAGFIQAPPAVATDVVAKGDAGTATLNYGYNEFVGDYSKTSTIHLQNFGGSAVTFDVASALDAGRPHSLAMDASITVPAHGKADFSVTLNVPVATAGDSSAFNDVAGLIRFTPRSGANSGVALDVPYYMVPQANSKIMTSINSASLKKTGSATATVRNGGGATTGTADWYAWGVSDAQDVGGGSADVRAAGMQAFPGVVAFGIDTWGSASNWAMNEFDIYVDVNADTHADYVVFSADEGAVTTGTVDGRTGVFVYDLRTSLITNMFLADAPFNGRTLVLPAFVAQLCRSGSPCLSAASPRLTYQVIGFGRDGSVDVSAPASFDAFNGGAISNGMFDVVAPGGSATETVSINAAEQALTPALGLMIISHDNRAVDEAQLIAVP